MSLKPFNADSLTYRNAERSLAAFRAEREAFDRRVEAHVMERINAHLVALRERFPRHAFDYVSGMGTRYVSCEPLNGRRDTSVFPYDFALRHREQIAAKTRERFDKTVKALFFRVESIMEFATQAEDDLGVHL